MSKSSSHSTNPKRQKLIARIAVAQSKADEAKKSAQAAKAVAKQAKKSHKQARQAAKEAKKAVKVLKRKLVALATRPRAAAVAGKKRKLPVARRERQTVAPANASISDAPVQPAPDVLDASAPSSGTA